MDNEKYGIELELITNKFKQKMQEVKNAFKGITDKKVNLNANTAQIEYLKKQIGELTADLQVNAKTKFWNETETLKAEAQLERLTNQYNKLIAKQNEVQSSSAKSSANISKSIDRMTSKIKRFGLSLLSIRSIFSLVSRASSAYLAQDTELANKLQSVWAGLGALLAPIIEGIVNILAKAVKYIAIFIKALTGVDLLARAASKSMKAAAGSAKSLNKALAGFDELQNLDTDAGGGTGGIGGLGALDNVDLKWADKVREFGEWVRDNSAEILGFLGGLTTALLGLKKGGTIGKIMVGIGLVITGITLFYNGMKKILKGDLSGTNLLKTLGGAGITGLGAGLLFGGPVGLIVGATLSLITAVTYIFKANEDVMTEFAKEQGLDYKNLTFFEKVKLQIQAGLESTGLKNPTTELTKEIQKANKVTGWFGDAWRWVKEQVQGTWDNMKQFGNWIKTGFVYIWEGMKETAINNWELIKEQAQGNWDNMKQFGAWIGNVFTSAWNGLKNVAINAWEWIKEQANGTWQNMKDFGNWISTIFKNAWQSIKDGVGSVWSWIKEQVQGTWQNMKNFGNWIKNIFSNLWSGITSKASSAWNGIKNGFANLKNWLYNNIIQPIANWFKNLFSGISKSVSKIPNMGTLIKNTVSKIIPSYDVGTNYVPRDQLAYVHEGEAIVPKKYNTGSYQSNNNQETNALLEQVINAINNIEINPYTTVKDVGKASLSYINSKSRQLGESVVK